MHITKILDIRFDEIPKWILLINTHGQLEAERRGYYDIRFVKVGKYPYFTLHKPNPQFE